ncbi:MAG: hypothetical protein M3P46_03635 [Actinomycetota bacterium]|nr:hypothetical protein [Actinomycetota bacterium]
MPLVLSLAVVALVVIVWARVCVWLGQYQAQDVDGRSGGGAGAAHPPAARSWLRAPRAPRLPLLPEGHRPPPGLGPLSPSERFLTQEYSRGLRDLQMYLVDQQAAQDGR